MHLDTLSLSFALASLFFGRQSYCTSTEYGYVEIEERSVPIFASVPCVPCVACVPWEARSVIDFSACVVEVNGCWGGVFSQTITVGDSGYQDGEVVLLTHDTIVLLGD